MRKILVLAVAVLCLVFCWKNRETAAGLVPGRIANPQGQVPAKQPLRGKIVWVDRKAQAVWINLGQANGLERNAKIPVMQPMDDEAIKARIEVVRLLGKHLAEARILSEPQENPIRKGDPVFP